MSDGFVKGTTSYIQGVFGREVKPEGFKEGELAHVDVQHRATPQRVGEARRFFTEVRPEEFELIGSTNRHLRRKADGAEFSRVESDPLQSGDKRETCVESFFINQGEVWYLKPRGALWHSKIVEHGPIVSGVIEQKPGGQAVVRQIF